MEDALTISHVLDCAVHAEPERACDCGAVDRVGRTLVRLYWADAIPQPEIDFVTPAMVRDALGLPAVEGLH